MFTSFLTLTRFPMVSGWSHIWLVITEYITTLSIKKDVWAPTGTMFYEWILQKREAKESVGIHIAVYWWRLNAKDDQDVQFSLRATISVAPSSCPFTALPQKYGRQSGPDQLKAKLMCNKIVLNTCVRCYFFWKRKQKCFACSSASSIKGDLSGHLWSTTFAYFGRIYHR